MFVKLLLILLRFPFELLLALMPSCAEPALPSLVAMKLVRCSFFCVLHSFNQHIGRSRELISKYCS